MSEPSEPTVTFSDKPSPEFAHVPLPACRACGSVPPITVGVAQGDIMSTGSYTCGVCGTRNGNTGSYMGQTVDGELRAVFYDTDLRTLARLRQTLLALQAQGPGLAEEDVVAAVRDVSEPAASWLANRENRRDLMTAINLLLVTIGTVIALLAYNKAPDPQPTQIDNLIIQVENGQISDLGLPRKAPCWCGSGKRYKACHAPADGLAPPPATAP